MDSNIEKTPERFKSNYREGIRPEFDIVRPPDKKIRTCSLPVPPQVPAPDGITSRLLGDSSSSEALQSTLRVTLPFNQHHILCMASGVSIT